MLNFFDFLQLKREGEIPCNGGTRTRNPGSNSEASSLQLVCGGLASAFLADALLTSGRRYSSPSSPGHNERLGRTDRWWCYPTLHILRSSNQLRRTKRTHSTAPPRKLHVGQACEGVLEKSHLSRQCWCNEAHDRRDPTRASSFAATGPDAGVKRGTDKCETYARTHSAPHQNSSGAVI